MSTDKDSTVSDSGSTNALASGGDMMEAEDEGGGSNEEGQLEDDEPESLAPVDNHSIKDLNEVSCQFFGSFYNDRSNDEPSVELLSYSQPVRLTEIRVIPLGATVTLSSGVPQLGSTNPEKFDLEFFYQDATEPLCSTFKAISRFSYEEKSSIQLLCGESENPIFTTKLLVKGLYNSLTLATYGYALEAEDVPIKPTTVEIKTEPLSSSDLPSEKDKEMGSLEFNSNLKIKEEPSRIKCLDSPKDESQDMEIDDDVEMKDTFEKREEDLPQAIPTITTRVNFNPRSFPVAERRGSKGSILVRDALSKVEPFSSDEDPFDEPAPSDVSTLPSDKPTIPLTLSTEDMGAEDISDGEISSGEEDVLTAPYIPPVNADDSRPKEQPLSPGGDDRSTLPLPSANEVDPDLEEDFAEPAVEEILSDEEIHDYPDSEEEYDLAEYEAELGEQFGQPLVLDSFQIPVLKNFSIENYGIKYHVGDKSVQQKFLDGMRKYSKGSFETSMLESWIEFLEQLLPVFNITLAPLFVRERSQIVDTLCFWVREGIQLDSATTQSALTLKLRHIKAGLKLIHSVCNFNNELASEVLKINLDDNGCTIQHKLFQLLTENQHNTPVIQNLILKAFDATLTTRLGYLTLTEEKHGKLSIYEQVVDHVLDKHRSKRFEFCFTSFLRKVNVIRFLVVLEEKSNDLDLDTIMSGLDFMSETMENIEHNIGYPLRFLPAQSVLEIPQNNSWNHDPKLNFIKILKEGHFIKTCSSLLGANNIESCILDAIRRICACLLNWETGLIYLCEDGSSGFWKLLSACSPSDFLTYFAHSLQVVKCADALSLNSNTPSLEDVDESMDSIHSVYLALATPVGRKAITKTFSIGNLIAPIIQCIKDADIELLRECDKLSALERTVMNEYAVDLLCFILKTSDNFQFLRNHGSELFRMISSLNEDHEGYEKLNDLIPFLKPTLDPANFTLEGIDILSEILKTKFDAFLQGPRTADCHWGFTPEVVTILRILNGLALAPDDLDPIDDVAVVPSTHPDPPMIKEVKYNIGYVKMNSADIISSLSILLGKIVKEFEQPALYAYTFVRAKGDALVSVVLPIVRIIRKILTEVIQARNTNFRDMTQASLLLHTYSIFHTFPKISVSLENAQKVKQHIVATLQAYTTPVMKLGEVSEQELTKSIWTCMISEVIKFTLSVPCNFIPGLCVLSELLPMPLPMYCSHSIDEEDEKKLISLRRMWSAFLHGVSSQIQEMIGILCETTHRELVVLLRRVCLQLADLSPSTCLVVCRAIMDPIVTSIEADLEERTKENPDPSSSVTAWVEVANDRRNVQCSARTSRLLGFLASLVRRHGVIKAGVMHAFRASTKADEKFVDFMSMLSCILTHCSDQKPSSSHVLGQGHVLTIFHSLCNIKLNMLMLPDNSLQDGVETDYLKANALPQKDNINLMCASLLAFLNLQENILGNVTVIRKIFFALNTFCDTEYGFFHLRAALGRNPTAVYNFLLKLKPQELEKLDIVGVMESLEVVDGVLRFLIILISPQLSRQDCIELRNTILSVAELRKYLFWSAVTTNLNTTEGSTKSEDTLSAELQAHPLTQLQRYLRKVISNENDSQGGEEQQYLKTYMSEALDKVNVVTDYLNKNEDLEAPVLLEVSLMNPDSLTDLYSQRTLVISNGCFTRDTNCTSLVISTDYDAEVERCSEDSIMCDMTELSKVYLNNADILKELEIASNFDEAQGPSTIGDTGTNNRDLHSRPRQFDLLSNLRGGPSSSNLYGHSPRKPVYNSPNRGGAGRGGFNRGMSGNAGRGSPHFDPFRSRPPNTSRPPSLHVDDFEALESSGQGSGSSAGYNKGGRSNDSFRGRGSRGSPVAGRTFNSSTSDRGRGFRSPGSGGFFSQQQRNESTPPRSRGRGNRGFGSGHDRWQGNNESRGSPGSSGNFGDRQGHSRNYERGPAQGQARGSGSGRQSYGRGHGYREAPASGGTRAPASSANNNATPSPRWRDKPRQFNR